MSIPLCSTGHARRCTLSMWLAFLCIGTAGSVAFADGKFFTTPQVVDEPGIQSQRAVVAFRDGVETLIVQSDLTADGETLGWILPVPAEPTAIAACTPNCLKQLSNAVQPRIGAGLPSQTFAAVIVLAGALLAWVLDRRRQQQARRGRSFLSILVLIITALLALVALLPTLATTQGTAVTAGVDVLQATRAGVYDVSVIRGDTAQAVQDWLTTNGFACPPAAVAVLQEYVQDGWCFLAARISPEATGEITHHPLRVTFPTKDAVYPLRLTGVGAAPIQLDVFVIAERQAAARELRTWFADTLRRQYGPYDFTPYYVYETPPLYTARTADDVILGIPDVTNLMWPNCVLTRLHGRLSASAMRDDLRIVWRDVQPTQATVFSRSVARQWSGFAALVATVLVFGWSLRTASRRNWSGWTLIRRRGLAAIVCAIAIGGGTYLLMDVVPVNGSIRTGLRLLVADQVHRRVLADLYRQRSVEDVPAAYREAFIGRSASWGHESNQLSEPGDYYLTADADGANRRITILDKHYVSVTIPFGTDGRPILADTP